MIVSHYALPHRLLLHWGLHSLKPAGQYPESIIGNHFPMAGPVFEDPCIHVHASSREGFHDPHFQWEGVITEDEAVDFGHIICKGFCWAGGQWCHLLSFPLSHYT